MKGPPSIGFPQDWWAFWSFGLLKYDMSRTQSIMRIASTASPISGAEVRQKMLEHKERTSRAYAVQYIQMMWRMQWMARGLIAAAQSNRERRPISAIPSVSHAYDSIV
mmetsp:Transcript_6220/g.19039  ORF Transcript_6220/g.19039 Transcript_6220/m.19039 type:complete len:108 (-) Transcript_6220:88-411(-)|eukprot:scaffold149520_cov35-Tisochrysis_lutea.AAC.1